MKNLSFFLAALLLLACSGLEARSVTGLYNASMSNGRPYFDGTRWFSLFDSEEVDQPAGTLNNSLNRCPVVFSPTAGTFEFDYDNQFGAFAIDGTFNVDLGIYEFLNKTALDAAGIPYNLGQLYGSDWQDSRDANNVIIGYWGKLGHENIRDHRTWHTYSHSISQWIDSVSVKEIAGSAHHYGTRNLKILMAAHIRLEDGTKYGAAAVTRTATTTTVGSSSLAATEFFRSFLTELSTADLLVTPLSGDTADFRINSPANRMGDYVIAVPANSCGVYDKTAADQATTIETHAGAYEVKIYFCPQSEGAKSATFRVSNGLSHADITVTGTADPMQGVIAYDPAAHDGWTFQTNENPVVPLNIAENGDLWGNHNDRPDLMNDRLVITTSDADIIAYNAANHTLTIRGINSDPSGNTTAYIYATFAATDRITSAVCTIPVTIHEVPITLAVARADLDALLAASNVNTASYHVDLASELRTNRIVTSNYYAPQYSFGVVETAVGELDAQGRFTGYRHEPFTFTITARSGLCSTTAAETITFTVPYGTMTFTNGQENGLWNDPLNWTPFRHALPTDQQDVLIRDTACSLTATDGAQACHGLTVTAPGSLVIGSGAVLSADSAVSAEATGIILAQDAANSGTFVFMKGAPRATVECYFKGTIHPEGAYHHPDWQYRGVIGTPDVITGWTDFFAYRWNEALNGSPTGCWEDYQRGPRYTFEPWKGYSMDNDCLTPRTLSYTTTLIPAQGGHEYTIVGTDNGSNNNNRGNNLITNSFSAPVDICNGSLY